MRASEKRIGDRAFGDLNPGDKFVLLEDVLSRTVLYGYVKLDTREISTEVVEFKPNAVALCSGRLCVVKKNELVQVLIF